MQKIKCIIIEDEPLAVEILIEYIRHLNYIDLCGVFRTTADASDFLQTHTVDFMFLDIHLPGLKGLTFLRTLLQPPMVIVTTAYQQYAVEGFELNVTDYLLKPYSFERFVLAVKKVTHKTKPVHFEKKEDSNSLYIMTDRKNVRIEFDNIIYIKSKREYIQIFTSTGNYSSKMSTKEIESKLPKSKFKRIHRSYIIALNRVESFTKRQVQINGKLISIGKDYGFPG